MLLYSVSMLVKKAGFFTNDNVIMLHNVHVVNYWSAPDILASAISHTPN